MHFRYLLMRAVSTKIRGLILYLIGFAGIYGEVEGSVIAIPGIAEKGYIDVKVSVSTPGGHSSAPPAHTVSHCVFWRILHDSFYRVLAS